MHNSNKTQRVESQSSSLKCPAQMTVAQLRMALRDRNIQHKSLKRKAELVQRLQAAMAEQKHSSQNEAMKTGNCHTTAIRTDWFHRIPADCVVNITQYLSFK